MKFQKDLISAILIAKLIIDEHPAVLTAKELDREFLGNEKFNINKQVQLHFTNKNFIPVIKKILRSHAGLEQVSIKIHKIDTNEFDTGGSRIAGLVGKIKDNGYVILLNSNETYCTQRLTLCKELSQIYADNVTDSVDANDPYKGIMEAARDLLTAFYYTSYSPKFQDKLTNEMFAHAIALELMIPYTLRGEIAEQLANDTDKSLIAERLRITRF